MSRCLYVPFSLMAALSCAGCAANPTGSTGTTGSTHGTTLDGGSSSVVVANAAEAGTEGGTPGSFIVPTGQQAAREEELFTEGSTLYAAGRLREAAAKFEQLYTLDPTPDMAFNLATVYQRIGEWDGAIKYFQIILDAHPDAERRTLVEGKLVRVRADQRRMHDGVSVLSASNDALNEEGRRWFNNGLNFFRQRQYQQALIAFEQAYAYVKTPDVYFNLASTHERLGHNEQAVQFYQDYLSLRQETKDLSAVEEEFVRGRITALQQ